MKIAILSDIHENFHNLILALQDAEKRNVEYILCLGDLMNTGIARILSIQKVPVYLIWGNNDGEKVDIMRAAFKEGSNLVVALSTYDFLDLGGKKIFITHYDDLAKPMAESGRYDAIFYGHNHLKNIERVKNTFVVNPGEICAQKTGMSSYAIYDTESNTVELIELEKIVTLKTDFVDQYMKDNMDKLAFRSEKSFKLDK